MLGSSLSGKVLCPLSKIKSTPGTAENLPTEVQKNTDYSGESHVVLVDTEYSPNAQVVDSTIVVSARYDSSSLDVSPELPREVHGEALRS